MATQKVYIESTIPSYLVAWPIRDVRAGFGRVEAAWEQLLAEYGCDLGNLYSFYNLVDGR